MVIIMLTGEPNKGKTAALHFVHEILVAYGAKTTCFKHIGAQDTRDFSDVLEYRKKTINILTMGDLVTPIKEALSDTRYDFLICACNNQYGQFLQQANHRIEKTVAETNACRLAANWFDANRIIELLEKSI
jgi:hypothetical protein